ncbi:MAG: hypothetical protein CM15mP49_25620 [Actinomycetota bacterium]|nr:MAG: hypothetical protein CM15mP49_25620 [Actinomycetota bacterium]
MGDGLYAKFLEAPKKVADGLGLAKKKGISGGATQPI